MLLVILYEFLIPVVEEALLFYVGLLCFNLRQLDSSTLSIKSSKV